MSMLGLDFITGFAWNNEVDFYKLFTKQSKL
jgi:hypothetical protein